MQDWFAERELYYIPSAGNFLTVRFAEHSGRINQQLLEHGIIVRPVANYGMPEFLRISVGNSDQVGQLFSVLDKIL